MARALDVGAYRRDAAGRVSVIIPAYNAAATIERTISSVLNQTYTDLEVLVVDDGSTDETALLVRQMADLDHRITLLRKTNGGPVSARNYGIAHASGEFIAPLDADDLWHPEKIRKQVALMQDRGDEVGLIYTWARAIDEQDRVIADIAPVSLRGNVYAALIIRNFVPSGAPLVRRNCVDEVVGYDVTLAGRGATRCEDFKFNLDIAERYDFDLVPEFLKGYRFRAGNRTSDTKAQLRSHELVVREARARHPELPDKLFRWAAGHYHREFGLSCLGDGYVSTGARLLLRAVVEDPLAMLKLARRAIAGVSRRTGLRQFVRARIHTSDGDGIINRKFLEVDPTLSSGRSNAEWSRKRLAYIAERRVERAHALPFATTYPS
jgi:glycosyltransferase involved in cell wall biosynthesis